MTVTSAQALASATAALAAIEPSWINWHVVQADGGPYLVGFNGVTISKAYIIVAPNLSYGSPAGGYSGYDRSLSGYNMIFSYDECSLPYVLDPTGSFCAPPPTPDYTCALPKEWILTVEGDYKCALVSNIPSSNVANTEGVYGTPGDYHTTQYLTSQNCDVRNPYECVPVTCFWTEKINSKCEADPL